MAGLPELPTDEAAGAAGWRCGGSPTSALDLLVLQPVNAKAAIELIVANFINSLRFTVFLPFNE
jgi:hypothetical protein